MRILQAGRAKSGNFWLYTIIKTIVTKAGHDWSGYVQTQPIYEIARHWELSYRDQAAIDVLDIERYRCYYRISSIFRMPIDDIDEYLSKCTLVWTHSSFCEQSAEVLPKFDKVVYVVRDPRDAAI